MTRRGTNRLLGAVLATSFGIVVAVLAGKPEAAVFAAPWAVLLVLGLSHYRHRQLDVRVEVDKRRVIVGDEVEVATMVQGAPGTLHVQCLPGEVFWGSSATEETANEAHLHDVLVNDRATVRIPLPTKQWGVHDVGRIEVAVTEPYGLFRESIEVAEPRIVRVHPKPAQAQNLLSPWLVRRVTGAHRSKAVGRGVEYADIRPFAPGDSLREINWRATARSSDLWISQRHPDRATDVILLVDSFVESGHDVRTVFGLAIEAALALAEGHLGVADRVGLVELGGVVRWFSPAAGRHQLQRLTDGLLSTGLHSHIAERNLAVVMSQALPPRSFVVALSPLLDDRFIDALHILGAHGHDVAVIECEASWPGSADDSDETGRLARTLWEAERQMIRDRLAEHGIAVAKWRSGDRLDLALLELTSYRRRAVRGRRR